MRLIEREEQSSRLSVLPCPFLPSATRGLVFLRAEWFFLLLSLPIFSYLMLRLLGMKQA